MRPKVSLLNFLCVFFILPAIAQVPEKQYDSMLNAQFPADGPGAVVLLAREGKVLYEKAFGLANIEQDLPMKSTDVFRIGSNTKQFTAVAILKLAEAGKLTLQDDITKYIPGYPTHGKTITIESLLTHTSGVKNYTGLPGFNDLKRKSMTPAELVGFFKDAPMDFDPGTDFRYDNSGYILLGYIIEEITGQPYAQYIRENIFQPAGMTHSFYDEPQELIPGRIAGYKKAGAHYVNADFLDMSLPYAAGSLLSTAGDLCLWYQALVSEKIISTASLEKAWSSYRLPGGRPTGYGYGWFTGNVQGSPSVKHVGVVNGFVTYAAYLPKEMITAVILSNSEATDDLDVFASELVAVALGKPYQFSNLPSKSAALKAYQGVYHTPYDGDKTIQLMDGHLEYFYKGGRKQELLSYGKDRFYIPHTLMSFDFGRNTAGQVNGFTLNSTDMPVVSTITAEKVVAEMKIQLSRAALDQLVGKYQFSGFVLEIERTGDTLYGKVGNDRKELVPFAPDKVFARDMDATLVFTRDAAGKITGMTKIQNSEMSAKKIE